MEQTIHLIGLNHRSAELPVRECFALAGREYAGRGPVPPGESIAESLWLSTCNRVEILAVGSNAGTRDEILHLWSGACGRDASELLPHIYHHSGSDAVRHLFSVACSLDSLVLGEPQILGQLKYAYKRALEEEKTVGSILNRLMHQAFSTAKRVRTQTALASSAVSISYAAVELAKRIFGGLADKKVLLIGAGEMAELAAAHLVEGQGAHLDVTNRTFARACDLALRFGGNALHFEELPAHLQNADIVISSTGSRKPVLTAAMLKTVMKRRKNRPVFIIDIAVPRDVESAVDKLDNIYLYTIDDLGAVVEENRAARQEEAVKAEIIVREEAERFAVWLASRSLQAVIADMVRRSGRIAGEELERTLRRLGPASEETRLALEAMLEAVVKKMNHDPIVFLKRRFAAGESDPEDLVLVRAMFNLDTEKNRQGSALDPQGQARPVRD